MADASAGAKPTEEQLVYARLLDKGMKLGIVLLILSFGVYVTGVLPPHIPLDDLPKYWGMGIHDYLQATGIKPGLAWVSMLHKGDFLNFVGIAFLAGVTILCYIPLVWMFFSKKDTIFGVIALLEILVLSLAASGVLQVGGH
ncbi:MAG: hypothetical protein HQL56_11250 [Magnetococcales bacterium]|nr:hypothetical protein [Magnetococcales bacterium]